MKSKEFIEKMLELGAEFDKSSNNQQKSEVLKKANMVYDNHLKTIINK